MNAAQEPKAKKRMSSKTVRTVLTAVVIVLLVAAIAIVLTARLRGEPIFIFGYTVMWVHTGSMESTIPAESFILAGTVSAENVEVGDVITFRTDDPKLIEKGITVNTHRVIEIVGNNEEFVTQGDYNTARDEYTAKAANVLARYERNLPVLTLLGRFFKTPAGLVCALAGIVLICFLLYLPDILKKRKKKAETEAEEKQKEIDEAVRLEVERMKAETKAETDAGEDPGTDPQE